MDTETARLALDSMAGRLPRRSVHRRPPAARRPGPRRCRPDAWPRSRARASAFATDVVRVVGPAAGATSSGPTCPSSPASTASAGGPRRWRSTPAYDVAGASVWASGLVALSGTPGTAYEQATLLYLLSLEGEAGHACPATCTIGLARALRRVADDEVRDRFLPALVDPGLRHRRPGLAVPDRGAGRIRRRGQRLPGRAAGADGTYRITGEKWFCSVADAGQFFLTARVERRAERYPGPRELRGPPRGRRRTQRLRPPPPQGQARHTWPGLRGDRLRRRPGLAHRPRRARVPHRGRHRPQHQPVDDRRRRRRHDAPGLSGGLRLRPSTARRSDGRSASSRPSSARSPTWRPLSVGALHLVLALTGLEDRIDAATAAEADVLLHRFLVNLAKYLVSCQATDVVHAGIEVLGGNGAIEDFSVLPRLYRDAMVYESWEGSHNVLVAQVLNDLRRLPDPRRGRRPAPPTVAPVADRPSSGRRASDEELDRRHWRPPGRAWRTRTFGCLALPRRGRPDRRAGRGRLLAEAGEEAMAWHLVLDPADPRLPRRGRRRYDRRVHTILAAMG